MATLGARGFSCAVFGVKPLQPWRRPVTDEPFRGKRRTQKKTSDSQGTKWPIPSKDKSTCKMSFERRGLLRWRLFNQGTGRWK